MRKRNKYLFLALLLAVNTTSCCRRSTSCSDPMCSEIPCAWHAPSINGMTAEDPFYFLWWESLDDPVLTSFIMEAACRNNDVRLASLESKVALSKTMNDVSADIAKNYIEFRGLHMRMQIIDELIAAREEISKLNKDLSKEGFVGIAKEYEDQKTSESFLIQKARLNLSAGKNLLRLSTLLNYPPRVIQEMLCNFQSMPDIKGTMPVGYPSDLISGNPSVQEAKRQYEAGKTKATLFIYQKTILDSLEKAETALAAFDYQSDALRYLESAKNLKARTQELTEDLHRQGLKDDREMLLGRLELLAEEDALIQGRVELLISYINLYHALTWPWEPCN